MIYPKHLSNQSNIGICAPSGGIPERKAPSFDLSLSNIMARGFNVFECSGIRTENYPSDTAQKRGDRSEERRVGKEC